MLTTQQIFDHIVRHMEAQGNKGGFIKRGWGYVNPDNPVDRCAIGSCMYTTDALELEKISKGALSHFSGSTVVLNVFKQAVENFIHRALTNDEINMLFDLAQVFEGSHSKSYLNTIAKKYNLTYFVVTNKTENKVKESVDKTKVVV